MPTLAQALANFRRCSDALAVAAEAVRSAVEVEAVAPHSGKGMHPRVALIQHIVATHFGFNTERMLSRERTADIALARQTAMVLCREFTKVSLKSLGRGFGKRDHGTVLHAVHAIEDRASVDIDFAQQLAAVRERVAAAIAESRANPLVA